MTAQQTMWSDVVGNHLISPRLTAEECGNKVFDELAAATRLSWTELTERTGLSRAQLYNGIRWLRDNLGEDALVCNKDHTYELAIETATVSDYRRRRLLFIAHSVERLRKVLKAGVSKFGGDEDTVIATELLGSAVSLLQRGARVKPEPRREDGFAELAT